MSRVTLLVICFLGAAGCESLGPVTTIDGSGWEPATSQPALPASACVSATVLGATDVRPEALAAVRKTLLNAQQEPLETRALTLANIGIAATHLGALAEARAALDRALEIINAVICDPHKSLEIARLSGEERTKIFKGEPHERALCNMYRGLIYLADKDYEGARACFRRADMERANANASPNSGHWVSLDYLNSVADAHCRTQLGVDWMRAVPEELQVDPYSPGDNTLVVVMAGLCPSKVHRQGRKEHGLAYGRIPSDVAAIAIGGCELDVKLSRPTEDLFLQAVSNGRRDVDALLAAKQQAADVGQGVGDATEVISAALLGIPYVNLAIYPLLLVGALSRDAAASTDSTADLRSVVGPGHVYIGTVRTSGSELTVRAEGQLGQLLGENRAALPANADGGLRVVLVRVYR